MAASNSGSPTGDLHDSSDGHGRSREIATRLELRDVAALGDDLTRLLGGDDA